MSKHLTPKHQAFIAAWIENGHNGTRAVLLTLGCSTPNCAASCASRLLRTAKVQAVVESAMDRLSSA
jgi:hypothetical protein